MNFKTMEKVSLPSSDYLTSTNVLSHRNESGRSMVEMLGVLAIIGVITIGGIMGYNYGMNKYRTNEVLSGASKRATILTMQMTMGLPKNLSEFEDENITAGGTFLNTAQEWDSEFGISITGVRGEVCESLIKAIGDKTSLRAVRKSDDGTTNLEPGSCGEGNNSLYLVFNKNTTAATQEVTHYCSTNECDLDCNGTPCKILSSMTYADSATACGGEQNMFTPEELGCSGIGSDCIHAPSGSYWLVGDVPEDQGGSANAYFVIAGRLGRWNRVLTRPVLCK